MPGDQRSQRLDGHLQIGDIIRSLTCTASSDHDRFALRRELRTLGRDGIVGSVVPDFGW